MLGIDPDFVSHKFMIDLKMKSVTQRKRKIGDERRKAVQVKMAKLEEANFIREV